MTFSECQAPYCLRIGDARSLSCSGLLVPVQTSAETEHMIGDKEISLIKPTAYLINTARDSVVEEKALIGALRRKNIAGAGLDVFS
jgi:phosphoglycerate dehydrogenase-like enzyme